MPTVVFDSSVLIPVILSFIFPVSRSTRLFSRLRAVAWHIAVSPQILVEVREKMFTKKSLRDWLELTDEEITQFVLPCLTKPFNQVQHTNPPGFHPQILRKSQTYVVFALAIGDCDRSAGTETPVLDSNQRLCRLPKELSPCKCGNHRRGESSKRT
jgi:hypothetical protein